ncbi:hypothetical protein AAF712_012112 [Marasmius tenuissimus]|uniref:Terpene synthase n=1 Tax=Marasmius tenuissimus TaxID=585030 RepID=A0ABR2ZID2_9AGAR|nr:hypothetical protein PM082_012734 [Marasmius tenuissimus]
MPSFILPDILQYWPWKRTINPHYEECRRESMAWSRGFNAMTPKVQAAFELFDPPLLASLGFPKLSKAGCRVVCDLMFYVGYFDDRTDAMNPAEVQEWVSIVMDILRGHRPAPADGPIIGPITQSFWDNAKRVLTDSCQRHFITEFETYLLSVVQQAEVRGSENQLTPESYMIFRRGDICAMPMFVLLLMEMDIPPTFLQTEPLAELSICAVDMIILANDLYSYNVEQARGEAHNIVSIVMMHHDFSLDEAISHITSMHDSIVSRFIALSRRLPSFGSPEIDGMALRYVDGLGNWIRANECWSFESWRYFRDAGPQIQKDRVVELLPVIRTVSVQA